MSSGYYVMTRNDDAFDLHFDGVKGAPAPTEEENLLVQEIDRTQRGIVIIYAGRIEELKLHFGNLAGIALAGLVGPQAQPAFARRMLGEFRAGILEREAGPRKNRYMGTLGSACARLAVPTTALAILLHGVASRGTLGEGDAGMARLAGNFLLVLGACAAGVWVSFGARKPKFAFEDLIVPEDDFLYPWSRLAFAALLTSALALVFHSGAAQVSLGSASTSEVLRSPVVALIVGFLCGFSEQVLAKSVASQATRLLGGT